jgi:hypothetical protein
MSRHHQIDYDAFLQRLVAGLRAAWEEVRARRPGEAFYTFGIETDSDVTDLNPICNTEEEYRAQGAPAGVGKWIGCPGEDSELFRAGREHTGALAREVNRYVFEDHSADPPEAFRERKKRLLKIFEEALARLDDEGFFGSGAARNRVLLKVEIVDPTDAQWRRMLKIIRRLNPPECTAPFFAALDAAARVDAVDRAQKEEGAAPVKAAAVAFLQKQKRRFDRCWGAHRIEEVTPFLLKILSETRAPAELWEVNFDAAGEPDGRLHGRGQLTVLVVPASGKCVIAP